MLIKTTRIICLSSLAFLHFLLLTSCGSTSINDKHVLIESKGNQFSKVYFIRPQTQRQHTFADRPVVVDLNQHTLMELGKGEYTLLWLKPGPAQITTKNLSIYTNNVYPVEMKHSKNIDFKPGVTYFIHIKEANEEFRGVLFLIEEIKLDEAKRIIDYVRPSGLARKEPIDEL